MNETFKTPFSRTYWRLSFAELKSVKTLVLAALFIALRIALKLFKIPIAANMNVFFTFTVNALGSFIYGPVVAFLSGTVCDTLSFIIKPSGPYNPAFMLVEALGSFIYALYVYRARVSVVRLFLSKLTVNVFCNIFLTSLFLWPMYGKGKTMFLYMIGRAPKNLTMLPAETVMLAVTFAVMLPILKRTKVLPWLKQQVLAIGVLGH